MSSQAEHSQNPRTAPRQCRVCDCTQDDCRECVNLTGRPCYWVEGDLCSACHRPHFLVSAYLAHGSDRYKTWRRIFGTDRIPIKTPYAFCCKTPEHPDGVAVYEVLVTALRRAQRDRAVAYITKRFKVTEKEARIGLLQGEGLPILAEDVSVSVDARAFL